MEEEKKTLERGSIVAFNEDGEKMYVVIDEFKIDGRRYHISQLGNNPAWPLKEEEIRKYRLAVREV